MSLCSGASVNTSSSDKQLDTVACSHEAAASFCDIVWGVVAKLRTSEARGEIYTMSAQAENELISDEPLIWCTYSMASIAVLV